MTLNMYSVNKRHGSPCVACTNRGTISCIIHQFEVVIHFPLTSYSSMDGISHAISSFITHLSNNLRGQVPHRQLIAFLDKLQELAIIVDEVIECESLSNLQNLLKELWDMMDCR